MDKKTALKYLLPVALTLVICITMICIIQPYNNAVETAISIGATGSDVTTIQTKLKRWGYYNGDIDGI